MFLFCLRESVTFIPILMETLDTLEGVYSIPPWQAEGVPNRTLHGMLPGLSDCNVAVIG